MSRARWLIQQKPPRSRFLDVTRPDFTPADAERIAREVYGIAATAKEFYSERDRVFHLKARRTGREHLC